MTMFGGFGGFNQHPWGGSGAFPRPNGMMGRPPMMGGIPNMPMGGQMPAPGMPNVSPGMPPSNPTPQFAAGWQQPKLMPQQATSPTAAPQQAPPPIPQATAGGIQTQSPSAPMVGPAGKPAVAIGGAYQPPTAVPPTSPLPQQNAPGDGKMSLGGFLRGGVL